ncbi:MAG: hypothetical protein CMC27_03130 [Flavobacteriaceae bacterium]|jgi:hypothetical protein|nr:hypothetical protein [Flavobacteriaceae bacterium]MBT4324958.1 DUF1643 domain-containing protein [Cryomorphaceae bacterium]MBT7740007.1 DUF1643 domain-containing protein [Cryomorphaceae bacterium]|tara:strand:- start:174 stop:656 length:483 start_codon:yes stop_codon:yes gene_type:complete
MDMALSIKNNILRKAKFSIDKKHRYELSRHWDLSKSDILFIMLNPSIANEDIDDPTIKRLISFTREFKHGGFFVANLFTYITPYSKTLDTSIGLTKLNLKTIKNLVNKVDEVIYAWGNSIKEPQELKNLVKNPKCFGKNLNGTPKHPLYLSSNSKLIKFR